jgi:hypothetical protein
MKTTKKNTNNNETQSGISAARSISTKIAAAAEIGEVMLVGGIVRKIESVTTQYGTQSQFVGDFVAEFRGMKYAAKRCYLPKAAAELLESADLEQGECKFAFVIKKSPSTKTKQGYTWDVQVPLAPQVSASPALELLEYCR